MKIKLKAWNVFSSVEVDVDMDVLSICNRDTDIIEVKQLFFCSLFFFFKCLYRVYIIPFFKPFSEKDTY